LLNWFIESKDEYISKINEICKNLNYENTDDLFEKIEKLFYDGKR